MDTDERRVVERASSSRTTHPPRIPPSAPTPAQELDLKSGGLRREQLARDHRDDPNLPVGKLGCRGQGDRDLGPRRHDHDIRSAAAILRDVGSPADRRPPGRVGLRSTPARPCRVSASTVGPVLPLVGHPPGHLGLLGIAGTQHQEVRDRPQRGKVLHGLVRRAVLADEYRVVREDVDHRKLRDGGQPHGGAHVVREHEKRGAERTEARRGTRCRCRCRPCRARGCRSGSSCPAGFARLKSPMSLRFVLFDGARSADPPTRFGTALAIAFSTWPLAGAGGEALPLLERRARRPPSRSSAPRG